MKLHALRRLEMEVLSDKIGRCAIHSSRMTTAQIALKKGAVVPRHSHENEQLSLIISGKLLFQYDDGEITAESGDLVEIAPNEPHRVEALDDTLAIDIFQPVRQDWIDGDDAYLRNPPDGSWRIQ